MTSFIRLTAVLNGPTKKISHHLSAEKVKQLGIANLTNPEQYIATLETAKTATNFSETPRTPQVNKGNTVGLVRKQRLSSPIKLDSGSLNLEDIEAMQNKSESKMAQFERSVKQTEKRNLFEKTIAGESEKKTKKEQIFALSHRIMKTKPIGSSSALGEKVISYQPTRGTKVSRVGNVNYTSLKHQPIKISKKTPTTRHDGPRSLTLTLKQNRTPQAGKALIDKLSQIESRDLLKMDSDKPTAPGVNFDDIMSDEKKRFRKFAQALHVTRKTVINKNDATGLGRHVEEKSKLEVQRENEKAIRFLGELKKSAQKSNAVDNVMFRVTSNNVKTILKPGSDTLNQNKSVKKLSLQERLKSVGLGSRFDAVSLGNPNRPGVVGEVTGYALKDSKEQEDDKYYGLVQDFNDERFWETWKPPTDWSVKPNLVEAFDNYQKELASKKWHAF